MRGTMLWFNSAKNFGFVSTDEGERLYVHRTGFAAGQVPEGRCAGVKVAFEREDSAEDGIPRAVEVTIVDDEPARRARLRHRHGAH